jgi:hypothetical protein
VVLFICTYFVITDIVQKAVSVFLSLALMPKYRIHKEAQEKKPNQPELNIVHEPESVVINDFYAKKCLSMCAEQLLTLPAASLLVRTGIVEYLEYQSVCPIVGNGPPPLQASVSPPCTQRGGGSNTLLRVRE